VIIYAYNHHVRLPSPEPAVVRQPQATRVEEPTLLCNQVTTLNESVFSTIPGSPAYVSKASRYRRNTAQFGLRNVDLQNNNAIQGTFRFVA